MERNLAQKKRPTVRIFSALALAGIMACGALVQEPATADPPTANASAPYEINVPSSVLKAAGDVPLRWTMV
jgi:hypothetical protein